MPLFEFVCNQCGQNFEELVRISTQTEGVTCPTCKSQEVKKKVSTFASKVSGGSSFSFGSMGSAAPCNTGST